MFPMRTTRLMLLGKVRDSHPIVRLLDGTALGGSAALCGDAGGPVSGLYDGVWRSDAKISVFGAARGSRHNNPRQHCEILPPQGPGLGHFWPVSGLFLIWILHLFSGQSAGGLVCLRPTKLASRDGGQAASPGYLQVSPPEPHRSIQESAQIPLL
mmetsp:Transcript_21804/g.27781  ORF Transcript_21804/g.27781 Transcript_21804/m.27781 type:complete len:155 (-) Transcript_21804:642-1106(-)|eukprot:1044414-Ditylum_brightwellii.AAC.1